MFSTVQIRSCLIAAAFLTASKLAQAQFVELAGSTSPSTVQASITTVSVTATRGIPSTATPSQLLARITTNTQTIDAPILSMLSLGSQRILSFRAPAVAVSAPTPVTVSIVNSPGAPAVQTVLPARTAILPPPALASVWPPNAAPGATVDVTIDALYTNFPANPAGVTLQFGAGITATPKLCVGPNPTRICATLVIAPNAPVGPRTVAASYGTGTASLANAFVVSPNPAITLRVIGDSWLNQGETKTLTFRLPGKKLSASTVFMTNFGALVSGPANGLASAISGDQASLTVRANRLAAAGLRNVVFLVDGDVYLSPNLITVNAVGYISSVTPQSVAQGAVEWISVRGVGTNWIQNFTTFSMGAGVSIRETTVLSPTAASVLVSVASDTYLGGRPVSASNGTSYPGSLQVTPAATPLCIATGSPVNQFALLTVSICGPPYTPFAAPISVSIPGATLGTISLQGQTPLSFVVPITVLPGTEPGRITGTVTGQGQPARTFAVTVRINSASLTSVCREPSCPSGVPGEAVAGAARARIGESATFRIRGSGTNFVSGSTRVSLSSASGDVPATVASVLSPTELLARFDVLPSAPGIGTLTVTTGAESVSYRGVEIHTAAPSVTITPDSGAQGTNVPVTIVASGGATLPVTCPPLRYPTTAPWLTCENYRLESPTRATATFVIAPQAPTGAGDSSFPASDGAYGSFRVDPGHARILSATPNSGLPGSNFEVTLEGSNTHWCYPYSATSCPYPANLVPMIQLLPVIPLAQMLFPSDLAVESPTRLRFRIAIPPTALPAKFQILVNSGGERAYLPNGFTVMAQPPSITSITPPAARQGDTQDLTFTYSGLPEPLSESDLSFALSTSPSGWLLNNRQLLSGNSVRANVSISPIAFPIIPTTVTTRVNGVDISGTYTVSQGPAAISSVTPNSTLQGQAANVTITGSFTHFTSGLSAITFAPQTITVENATVTSPTTMTARFVPAPGLAPGTYPFYVVTQGELANGGTFQVIAPTPTLTQVSPGFLVQGSTAAQVILTGQNTSWQQGVTTASFGAGVSVQSLTVDSPTSARAILNVDPIAATGPRTVTVTTGAQVVSNASLFQVTNGPALISVLTPTQGNVSATLTVSVTGSATHFQQGQTTASFGAGITINSVTIPSPTRADVNLTIAPNAALGFRTVTMTTGGEIIFMNNAFEVKPPGPEITAITPAQGAVGQVVSNILVTGLNLTGATFSVGGTQVLPATGTAGTLLVGANVLQVSNLTATSATLQIQFGRFTGAFPLIATSSAGTSATTLTAANQLTVFQGSGYFAAPATTVVNSQSTSIDPATRTTRYVNAPAMTVINLQSTGLDPASRNLRYASSYAVNVRNQSAASVAAPASETPSEDSTAASLEGSSKDGDAETAYPGSALLVRVAPPIGVRTLGVLVYCNGVRLADPLLAPYETLLTVPSGVSMLEIRAVAQTEHGEAAAPVRRIRILDEPAGRVVQAAVRDSDGRDVPDPQVTLRYHGFAAEHFRFDQPLARMPEIEEGRRPDAVGFAAVLHYGPSESRDPFGTGAVRDTASRYRSSLRAPVTGTYEFRLRGTSGAILHVGGKRIAGEAQRVTLEAGSLTDIEILHYRGIEPSPSLHLEWRHAGSAGEEFRTIAPEFLRAPAVDARKPVPGALAHFDVLATSGSLTGRAEDQSIRNSQPVVVRLTPNHADQAAGPQDQQQE